MIFFQNCILHDYVIHHLRTSSDVSIYSQLHVLDRLCGLVVRVLDYRSRGSGSDSRALGLERGPLSLVSTTEELLDRKVAAPIYKNREYGRRDPSRWPRGTLYLSIYLSMYLSAKVGNHFANKLLTASGWGCYNRLCPVNLLQVSSALRLQVGVAAALKVWEFRFRTGCCRVTSAAWCLRKTLLRCISLCWWFCIVF
jgi:hypothetical protein